MNVTGNGSTEERVPPPSAVEPSGPGADDPRVIAALEEYQAALQAGQAPSREALLARHPEFAAVLAECLEGLDWMHGAAPGRLSAPAIASVPALAGIQPGTSLGDFQIIREIGRGGMGVVYEAEQLSLRRRVALKVLPFASMLDAGQLQRFKNEAHAAAHLHHTNIVPVFATGCADGVHYYAMQLIEGRTLAALIAELRQRIGRDPALDGGTPAPRSAPSGSADPQLTGPYPLDGART
jgi:hypothetical protein